jgi:hypothetical protein
LAATAVIGASGSGGEGEALTDVSPHCCTKVSQFQAMRLVSKGLDQI